MRVLKAIALSYDAMQDRILLVVNPAALDSWSFWLTRRLVLQLLQQLPSVVDKGSPLAKQAPSEMRDEIAVFERQAAIASTEKAMSRTEQGVMQLNATAAELATKLSLGDRGQTLRLELHGERGGQAVGDLTRAEIQRTLKMIQDEAVKAQWIGVLAADKSSADVTDPAMKPIRH